MDHADFAAFGVIPAHRNLPKPQAGAVSEKKEFDIKSKPHGMHLLQNWTANIETKCLETALGVAEWHPGGQSNDQIEDPAGILSSPRLPYPNQFPIERARTKSKIGSSTRDRFNDF